MTPFLFFVCSCRQLYSSFSLHFSLTSSVPPSVGHCPAHPPFFPYSLPLLHPQPHFPAQPCIILLLFLFYSLSSYLMPRFITPQGVQVHIIVTNGVCRTEGREARAVGSVYSSGLHANGIYTFMRAGSVNFFCQTTQLTR